MMIRIVVSAMLLVMLAACNSDQPIETTNTNTKIFSLLSSEETGIDFTNNLTEDPLDDRRNILSFQHFFNGAGVATADFNNDGLNDLIFISNEEENKLYINEGDLKFKDITATSGINTNKTWSTGVTVVDINNDGWMDIYICQSGPEKEVGVDMENLLFINNGDLTFSEKSQEYGLNDNNLSTQAAFFDYDMDGDLDCFVLNESKYVNVVHKIVFDDFKKSKKNLEKASCNLYRNDGGKFTKVTEEAGMLMWSFGLGLVVSDINQDGLPDVYVANDYSVPDRLFINQGDGTFRDEIKSYTNQVSFYSMGADIADINNDGHLDIAVVDMAADDHIRDKTLMAGMNTELFWYYINFRKFHYQFMFNALQLNNGNNTLSNIANMAGVARTDWSWASLLADFDNDGYKDYYVSNGYRRYSRDNDFRIAMKKSRDANGGSVPMDERQKFYDMMPTIKLKNRLYQNNGNLKFIPKEDEWGMDQETFSNGAIYVDLDNDGDLEVVVNNVAMPALIYKNNARENNANNYLQVDLKKDGVVHNTFVKAYLSDGSIQVLEYIPTRGYLSAMDGRLHFGLGKDKKVEKLEVIWPDSKMQVIQNPSINSTVTIEYNPTGSKKSSKKESLYFTELDPASLNVDFKHQENEFNDFAVQVLMPQKQSNLGPALASGDVNKDGLTDFYVGGALGQSGMLYMQNADGTFDSKRSNQVWAVDAAMEDVGALLYDADGDGDDDLYVVSGGYEYAADSETYEDRLYINMGGGAFQKVKQGLPGIRAAGSNIVAGDYDGDGDLDLFVGGKVEPGKYPFASKSQLLIFDKFKYTDQSAALGLPDDLGIVTDAAWIDYDNNGTLDLLTVGEWSSPRLFSNTGGKLTEVNDTHLEDYSGWWFSVEVADFDGDGDQDIIAGNLGMNSKFKASSEKPFKVFASDFDGDGSSDVILSKDYKGKDVPTRGRQCSSEQLPFIKDKFGTYKEFANASVIDIIGESKAENSLKLNVTEFASKVFINNGDGTFKSMKLPMEAQKAPILDIVVDDLNKDGIKDLIVTGNIFEAEVETPRYDAGTGQVLIGKGDGTFKALSPDESGFFTFKNAKHLNVIKRQNDQLYVVANNNDRLQFFKKKK